MKKLDFIRYMGNINEKYVIESEKYRPVSRNWVKVTAIAACIAIIATSIPLALVLNREDAQTDAPVAMPMDTKDQTIIENPESFKIIYCSSEEAQAFKEAFKDRNVEIREDAEANFDLSTKASDVEAEYSIPARVYLSFKGKEYSFTLQETNETKLVSSTDEYLKTLGYQAIYYMDDNPAPYLGELMLEYNYVTNQIISIEFTHEPPLETDNALTKEEIEVVASNDMGELFGSDFFGQYTLYQTLEHGNGRIGYRYLVNFRRYICGYPTNERIYVSYSLKGELLAMGSNNLGTFENLATKLDEDAILAAEAEALSLLEGKNIIEKLISVGIDGKAYMTVYYSGEHSKQYIHYEIS